MAINLGIGHLRALVALADEGTFTAAADSLGLAQSSLSRSVSEAERRLRVPLFVRTTRHVAPTTDGEAVVAIARSVVQDFDTGLAHVQGYLTGTRGSLRIATLPSLAATLLPPFVMTLRNAHPDVAVTVEDRLSEGVLQGVRNGAVDLAITARGPAQPRHSEVLPLATDDFFLAVPPEDALAERTEMPWAELTDRPLVGFAGSTSIRQLVDQALGQHDVVPGSLIEAQNVGSVAGLVAGGLGVAAVPGFVLPLLEFAHLRYVPLVPTVSRSIVMLRDARRPVTPAVRTWLGLLTGPDAPRPRLRGVHWALPETGDPPTG